MSDYNLYDSLSLDASANSADLIEEIDNKLAQVDPGDAAARDELSTARQIFSADNRRKQYDNDLANTTGPEVNIARIRYIAALPSETAPQENLASYTPAPEYTPQHSAQPQQDWKPQATNQQFSSSSSFNVANKQVTVDFSNVTFPVEPDRQRCQSIMWCVLWGILLLMWLIAGIRGLSLAGEASDTTAMGLIFDSSELESKTADFSASLIKTLVATPLMLILWEFVWSIRKTIGRRAIENA